MYHETAHWLAERVPHTLVRPAIAIICGTGLHGLEALVNPDTRVEFAYKDIPHFPQPSGKGFLLCGLCEPPCFNLSSWLRPRTNAAA